MSRRERLQIPLRRQAPRQTLRGAFEWSYNLLSEPECILMRRLSVFSGGWTSGSAEAICGDAQQEAKENPLLLRGEVLDLLIQLADKSLLITEKLEDETRFHFLETTLGDAGGDGATARLASP